MTTVNIVATAILGIAVLFLIIIPIIRILFNWKKIKKLPIRESKFDPNDETDTTTDPMYSFRVQNLYYKD